MEHEVRILLLEDSPQDAEFVERELRRGKMSFNAQRADTRETFVEQLEEFQPDFIIADYMLPSFDGLTALALTRERFPELPFILVSGYIGEERATEALKCGATDFLLKASLSARLIPTVQRAIREVEERRERKLLEAQLRQAQKMEAVGQLTGGLVHDFNNLLTIIIGNIGFLKDELEVDSEAYELAEVALEAGLRGADLTRQLGAFSRSQFLEPHAIDLNELVADTTDLLRRTLGAQIEIKTSLAADLWPAFADPTQVESAFANLAINARDAMPQGGHLVIETANKPLDASYAAANVEVEPDDYVMLAVSDTGHGMPPEIVEKVFEPFFTTKEMGKGTGLGLSMVYGFVKQSGGHVKIYSEVGHGTTVRVYLPRAGAQQEVEDAEPPEEADDARPDATILVVEDDANVRSTAVLQLRALGYRVLEAEDAKAALELLGRDQSIDLLFTDIVMPRGMSGPGLAREARKARPELKVLFTSGYAEAALRDGTHIDEIGSHLSKPYRKDDLARKVREVLSRGRDRREK